MLERYFKIFSTKFISLNINFQYIIKFKFLKHGYDIIFNFEHFTFSI